MGYSYGIELVNDPILRETFTAEESERILRLAHTEAMEVAGMSTTRRIDGR